MALMLAFVSCVWWLSIVPWMLIIFCCASCTDSLKPYRLAFPRGLWRTLYTPPRPWQATLIRSLETLDPLQGLDPLEMLDLLSFKTLMSLRPQRQDKGGDRDCVAGVTVGCPKTWVLGVAASSVPTPQPPVQDVKWSLSSEELNDVCCAPGGKLILRANAADERSWQCNSWMFSCRYT
jgi:hypothetical protein